MTAPLFTILGHAALPKGGAEEVGNKAWNLMRMTAAGLPVPPAFVLPIAWCERIRAGADGKDLETALSSGIAALETATGLRFGSPRRPLFVSVRSGAAVSMPGMMETVLNVGLNSESLQGLIGLTGNPRLAWDCYRRLVQSYAEVVQSLPRTPFDEITAQAQSRAGVDLAGELDYRAARQLARDSLRVFQELAGVPFPDDPREQLMRATAAVFRSWDGPKAVAYRRANGIENGNGTAATIQQMVFGNAGGASGTGVAFTRNPATGAPELYLDFEFNAQGEDVVAGRQLAHGEERLRRTLPAVWTQLQQTGRTLEALFRDAQDFEFTLQAGTLYMLQTRAAKRTPWAALCIAVDQVDEALISPEEALARLSHIPLESVVRTRFAATKTEPLTRAQVASIGVAAGVIALDSESANRMTQAGTPVILVRREVATSDISGMMSATGILTGAGGRTSHGAVVARQLSKVCLVGCRDLEIDFNKRSCRIGKETIREGEFLSLDGNDGAVYAGKLEAVTERPERELTRIAAWRASLSNNLETVP
jgi:pyruvate,orthophosphate dikinase